MFTVSLRSKLTMLAVAVTSLTAIALSTMHFLSSREREEAFVLLRLEKSARVYSERVADVFSMIEKDAAFLARIPAVHAIAKDPQSAVAPAGDTASSRSYWRRYLEGNFTALMGSRPAYAQIRFIGLANNWTELARVNRTELGMSSVHPALLQPKGSEPYLVGADQLVANQSYFSEITFNREYGQVVGPPMLRFVHAVVDPTTGKLHGVIVINAEYERTLREAAPHVLPGDLVTVVNDSLDTMVYRNADDTPQFQFHLDRNETEAQQASRLSEVIANEGLNQIDDRLYFQVPVDLGHVNSPFQLHVVTEIPVATLVSASRTALRDEAVVAALLVMFATIVAAVLGAQVTRPLTALSEAIANYNGKPDYIALDINSRDEIGQLAKGFVSLTNEIVRQHNRTKAILAGAGDAIVTLSEHGVIEEVNDKVLDLLGYEANEIMGQHIDILFPLTQGGPSVIPLTVAGGNDAQLECVGWHRNGTTIPLEISTKTAFYAGTPHVIAVVRDVTQRKESDRAVEELVGALKRSNAELDKFAYIASHDLKAPLRVIDNASRWLEEDLEAFLTDDARENIDIMRSRVGRMERLLDDLLQHARIGRETVSSEQISGWEMASTVRQLVELRQGFELIFDPSFEALEVPRMPIQTVLLNLVSNALKHHDRAGGKVVVKAMETPQEWVFTVTDDGPGIASQFHEKVFDLFQTLKPRSELETSGMGLAVVKKYIELAGGKIILTSDGANGCAFDVHWPKTTPRPESKEIAA